MVVPYCALWWVSMVVAEVSGTQDDNVPQDPFAILRTVNGRNTSLGIFLASKCNVDTDRLLMLGILPGFADDDLDDLAVLSKVVRPTQGVEQTVFADGGGETGHVDKVLLDDAQAGEVLATERVGLGLLGLLLADLGVLLGLLGDLLLVLGHPVHC